MEIAAIPMLINSDFMEIPLDKRLDLADYKMYGVYMSTWGCL